jgi:hypothetical protein
MKKILLTPDEYILNLPESVREDIQKLNKIISIVFGKDKSSVWHGKMWGGTNQTIIGYGDWKYRRSDKKTVDWFKVGLAVQKNYISLYINAVEDGRYVAKKYADKLGKVKVGSSSISFKKLAEVNSSVLKKLLKIAKQQ